MLKPRLKIVATIVLLLFITAILIAAVVYGGGLLWSAIRPAPTATPSPTPTATLTPSHTATLTDTATATGTFTPTPTPTATPTPTSTPTATSTHTPLPTPTDRPTETPTGDATRTPTPERPTPTPQAIYPAPTLREPGDGAQLAGRQRFVWQWDGPSLGENHAFDLRIWSQQEEKDGRPKRGAAVPTQDTETDVDLSYVPAITDYGPGDYFWTVVVVQVGSDGITKVLGEWGEKRRFTYGGPPASTSPPPTRPAPTPVAPTPTAAPFPTSTP